MATPPDVISQLLLAVPLVLLFEGSLVVMLLSERKAAKAAAAEAANESRVADEVPAEPAP